jgi:hypothetical protein
VEAGNADPAALGPASLNSTRHDPESTPKAAEMDGADPDVRTHHDHSGEPDASQIHAEGV